MLRLRNRLRTHQLVLAPALFAIACSGLELDPPPEVIHARFDPDERALPMPTDVVRDDEAGRLDLPLDDEDLEPAERAFFEYLNTMDGWSTAMGATVELTGPIDPDTVNEETLQVWEWRASPTLVEDLKVHFNATETEIRIDPPREGWRRGGQYVVLLRGGHEGIEGKRGERVIADAAFYLLRQTEALDTPEHERAFPGNTAEERREKAGEAEEIRAELEPKFDFFEERGIPRAEVASLWSFTVTERTELAMDKVSQRMPLPIDLLIDPATGQVDVPVADWDSDVVAEAKRKLGEYRGFGLAAPLIFGFTGPVDETTVDTDSVRLYRIDDGGDKTPVGISVSMLEDRMHVVVKPNKPLDETTRYAVMLSDSIRDADGDTIAIMPAGALMQLGHPVYVDGESQIPGVEDEDAEKLEVVRSRLSAPLQGEDGILAGWTFETMAVTEPMRELLAFPERVDANPNPDLTREMTPGQALADFALGFASLLNVHRVYHGTIRSPQRLDPLTRGFRTDGGHEVEKIPFTLVVPDDVSGPIPAVVFGHGLHSERRTLLALGSAVAGKGFALISVDVPFHGERTSCFSEDEARNRIDPETGEAEPLGLACRGSATCSGDGRCINPDGSPGEFETIPVLGMKTYSGAAFVEMDRIANTRDHFRQSLIDISSLIRSLEKGDWSQFGIEIDPDQIHYSGQSLGGVLGATLVANHPSIKRAVLNVPGANTVEIFANSPSFSARVDGLLSRENTVRGEYEAEKLLTAATWMMDLVDPQVFAHKLTDGREVLIQMATGDTVIPNEYTELLVELSGAPKRDYLGSHAFIAVPVEPAYFPGVSDLADFLAGELEQ